MSRIQTGVSQVFDLSRETRATQTKLEREISQFNTAYQDYELHANALREASPAEWSPSRDEAASKLRGTHIALLSRELALRTEMDEFFAAAEADRHAAVDAAYKAHEDAQAEVRRRLISIGYDREIRGGGGLMHDPITPEMIANHPMVCEAFERHEQASTCNQFDRRRADNKAGLSRCRGELEQLKKSATAGIA